MTVKIIIKDYPKIVVIAREVRLQDYSMHLSPHLLSYKQSVKFSKIPQRYSLTCNLLGIKLQYSLNRNTKNELASRLFSRYQYLFHGTRLTQQKQGTYVEYRVCAFGCMVKKSGKSRRRGNTFLLPFFEINKKVPLHLSFQIYFVWQELLYLQVLGFGI